VTTTPALIVGTLIGDSDSVDPELIAARVECGLPHLVRVAARVDVETNVLAVLIDASPR
jgi:hypothetical protein